MEGYPGTCHRKSRAFPPASPASFLCRKRCSAGEGENRPRSEAGLGLIWTMPGCRSVQLRCKERFDRCWSVQKPRAPFQGASLRRKPLRPTACSRASDACGLGGGDWVGPSYQRIAQQFLLIFILPRDSRQSLYSRSTKLCRAGRAKRRLWRGMPPAQGLSAPKVRGRATCHGSSSARSSADF